MMLECNMVKVEVGPRGECGGGRGVGHAMQYDATPARWWGMHQRIVLLVAMV